MGFRQPKIRIDAYLNAEDYVYFVKFCERNYCKNATVGVSTLIENNQNYEDIMRRVKKQKEIENLENIRNAEVIKQ